MLCLWLYIILLLVAFSSPFLPAKRSFKTYLFSCCIATVTLLMYLTGFVYNENLNNTEIMLRSLNGVIGAVYGVWLSRKYDTTKTDEGLQIILLSSFGVVLGFFLFLIWVLSLGFIYISKKTSKKAGNLK